MTVLKTPFNEAFLIKPTPHQDHRGSFVEHYNQKAFELVTGKKINFCQDNLTHSKNGVLRGLHYQLPPNSQSKLVSVLLGSVLDVIVDIRKGSPSFGHHFSQVLSDENQLQLFIPRGFAHGYITLSETSVFHYKVDAFYDPQCEGSIAPNDTQLGIDWQLDESLWIQSEKDRKHPTLGQAPLFDYNENLYD
ncbi:MAG: dTDP-4-dehydrorhamnose 3,5-epimerase [Flavobacteriaceae bacterium]|jgi:dTDP-4-dehydrorhamnose 3,5-epimerase